MPTIPNQTWIRQASWEAQTTSGFHRVAAPPQPIGVDFIINAVKCTIWTQVYSGSELTIYITPKYGRGAGRSVRLMSLLQAWEGDTKLMFIRHLLDRLQVPCRCSSYKTMYKAREIECPQSNI